MRIAATLALSFALAAALTPLFIWAIRDRNLVALPNHRTMHKGAIPFGGGLPLLTALLVSACLFWPVLTTQPLLVVSIVALAGISWWDDIRALPPAIRLATHVTAACLCMLVLPPEALVFQGLVPLAVDRLITGFAFVWFINLYNFMDGIDGIAGSETIAIAAGYLAVTWAAGSPVNTEFGIAIATIGAAAGFLVWNWHPAKVFLGDAGAVPLGFLIGWLLIDLAVTHSLAAAIILPLYFAADATLTLLQRLWQGHNPSEPHRSHFYQRAAARIGSHSTVVIRMWLCNLMLIVAAVAALRAPGTAIALAVASVATLLLNLELSSRRIATTMDRD